MKDLLLECRESTVEKLEQVRSGMHDDWPKSDMEFETDCPHSTKLRGNR